MSDPYTGEIRMFGGNFAPQGWALCNGQPMPISENEVLFTLIGTTYGGDGQVTFNLPNLQSRVPLHQGTGPGGSTYTLGEQAGVEQVTVTVQQTPSHTHPVIATTNIATATGPGGNVLAQSSVARMYIQDQTDTQMAATSIGPTGGSQPHENIQPYLTVNFIICLFGTFPQPN
ncbi:MAG TPA: tail fiber protein [Actinomycetota bacterium]